MTIQLIVIQSVTHNRIFLRKCARWSDTCAPRHGRELGEPRPSLIVLSRFAGSLLLHFHCSRDAHTLSAVCGAKARHVDPISATSSSAPLRRLTVWNSTARGKVTGGAMAVVGPPWASDVSREEHGGSVGQLSVRRQL